MNIINGKYDKVKVYMDGKELPVCEHSIVVDDSIVIDDSIESDSEYCHIQHGAYSFNYTTTDESLKQLLWIMDRPKRIKKYVNQIFSNDPL